MHSPTGMRVHAGRSCTQPPVPCAINHAPSNTSSQQPMSQPPEKSYPTQLTAREKLPHPASPPGVVDQDAA